MKQNFLHDGSVSMLAQANPIASRSLSFPRTAPALTAHHGPSRLRTAPCRAIAHVDMLEAVRLTAFTGLSVGGFVAGVELARQANKAIIFGRTMTPPRKTDKQEHAVFLATMLALDVFLVSSMGLASAGVAHGLLSQVPPGF